MLLERSTAREPYFILKYMVPGAGSVSESWEMFAPPKKKRKLHDSCHYTILAMLKLKVDHALFGGIHQKARLNSCVIKISNL